MFILLAWLAWLPPHKKCRLFPALNAGHPLQCWAPASSQATDQNFSGNGFLEKNKLHSKLTKKSHCFLLHLHIDIIQMIHNNIDAFGPVLSLCVVRVGDNKAGCGYWRVWEPAYCPHHTAALTQPSAAP